jgi:hypothetical protein
MQVRIRTIQVGIVLAAPAIAMLCEGAKAGCLGRVMFVWGALVAAPLFMMWLVLARVKTGTAREQVIALFGAIAVVGYALAIPVSMATMFFFSHQAIL